MTILKENVINELMTLGSLWKLRSVCVCVCIVFVCVRGRVEIFSVAWQTSSYLDKHFLGCQLPLEFPEFVRTDRNFTSLHAQVFFFVSFFTEPVYCKCSKGCSAVGRFIAFLKSPMKATEDICLHICDIYQNYEN